MSAYVDNPWLWYFDTYEWDEEGESEEDPPIPEPEVVELPEELVRLREIEVADQRVLGTFTSNSRTFYKQAKLAEDFELSYEGNGADMSIRGTYPTYWNLSDYQLLKYFDFRTRFRKGAMPDAPLQFIKTLAYELIEGIGVREAIEGYEELSRLRDLSLSTTSVLEKDFERWLHDYALYWGLDKTLIVEDSFGYSDAPQVDAWEAEGKLLELPVSRWPSAGERQGGDLPASEDLFDTLSELSRWRVEKSKFFRERRHDAAEVCCRVFARMVEHCRKRRKSGFIDGLFGTGYYAYSLFPYTPFYLPEPHEDTEVRLRLESFRCQDNRWSRQCIVAGKLTSAELGDILHAIDCKMRIHMAYPHPLKAKSIAKYQERIIDQEIDSYFRELAAIEATKIHIDRSSLKGIRTSAARTREVLLTDEERESEPMAPLTLPEAEPVEGALSAREATVVPAGPEAGLPLTEEQRLLVGRLLLGEPVGDGKGSFLSLEIDAINEVFLERVGDTVIVETADGFELVEDYIDEVGRALGN